MIRVCIVEDQTLVREGLQSLLHLSEDIRVVSQACSGREALTVLMQTAVDVMLLDIRMPDTDGLQLLRALTEKGASIPTIILTTFDEDELLFECLKLGVQGYLLKDVTLRTLTEAVRTVAGGGSVINPALTTRIVKILQGKAKPSVEAHEAFTERELHVVRLMTAGLSNGEIAQALGLAEGTVKNHVSNVLAKLRVRDRTRAVLKAIELGLLS